MQHTSMTPALAKSERATDYRLANALAGGELGLTYAMLEIVTEHAEGSSFRGANNKPLTLSNAL